MYLYENDQLPIKICSHCYNSLMKLYSFKIKCEDVCRYWKELLISKIKTEGEETNDEKILEHVTVSTNNTNVVDFRVLDASSEDPLKITLSDIKQEEIDDSFEDSARIHEEEVTTSEENPIDYSTETKNQRNTKNIKRKRNAYSEITKTTSELIPRREQNVITRCPIKYSLEDVKLKTKTVKCVLLDFKNKPSEPVNRVKRPDTSKRNKEKKQRKNKVYSKEQGVFKR